jgi:hypothetical protein
MGCAEMELMVSGYLLRLIMFFYFFISNFFEITNA